jgi:threonine/homoserine/homoserine lactone efflux protein
VALQVLGGLFLIYVAILTWRHAGDPLPASGSGDVGRPGIMTSLTLGLVTQLSNPKVVLFFSSIFLALLPVPTPLWLQATILVLIFLVDGGWYVLVALAFSNAVLRAGYERTKRTADRLAGGLLGVLGLRLLTGIRF